jgi:hypothetical protein
MHNRVISLFCFAEQTVTTTTYHDMLEDSSGGKPPANSHLPAGCYSTLWVSDSESIPEQSISKLLDWYKYSLAQLAGVVLSILHSSCHEWCTHTILFQLLNSVIHQGL